MAINEDVRLVAAPGAWAAARLAFWAWVLATSRTESCGGAGVVCAGTPVPPRDPLPPAQCSQREAGAWGRVRDGASMVLGGKDHPPRPGASSKPQGVVGLGRDPWRRSGPDPAPAGPHGAARPAPSPGGCWRPHGGAPTTSWGIFFFCVESCEPGVIRVGSRKHVEVGKKVSELAECPKDQGATSWGGTQAAPGCALQTSTARCRFR